MTEAEFAQAQATLQERDNQMAALAQQERDCTEQVRLFANGRRQAAAERTRIELETKPLRDDVAEYVQAQRAAEKARQQAEAEKQRQAEAAKPKEKTEVEKLRDEIAELKELVKAKG